MFHWNHRVPGPPPPPPEPPEPSDTIGEVGKVTTNQPDSATWHVVSLEKQYLNPVVIMQPPSFAGGQPVTVRLRNVTGSSFEFQMDEWDYLDGGHITETIGYLVLEAGQYRLSGGARVEVGTIEAQHEFKNVTLTQSFSQVPVILSQSQTRNGAQPVVTRQQNASPSGFEVRLQEEDGNDGSHAVETIGYIAIETGKRVGDLPFSVQRTPDVVTHGWYPIDFEIISLDPVFLAGMQT
ncbi:MAG: dockerin type I domain-containing protein, partial [Planctomycetota bacterium]